ncbi:DUF742 domain-containing protein [Streptomyces sp. SCUT-3]|uniref:DUF742 domain-containing protein n=1 Tax=Streptomyces sp. SCUT-3 TaxID=2684469 RepID=UPI000CB49584|nr:DUF742 domain-containing protein [Streptomyces sp. SCUT-3]PLW73322.1 DUF742 domain-containing protein [Streptomyces sp. DJ]QMV21629.1 DUF742 domain-containing protein [Streptomyces sp. SCUT-3]
MATPPGGYPYGSPYGDEGDRDPYRQGAHPQHGQGSGPQQYEHFGLPSSPSSPASPHTAPPAPSAPHIPPAAPGPAAPPAAHRGPVTGSDQQPLVRPYAMTGGRTRPRYQLAIEALVSTTADPSRTTGLLPEHQRICHLCMEIKSVAEISALLSIPLGVARILVADLAESGLVAIHQPGGDESAGGQPDVTLLERVLSGLRKL